MKLLLTSILRGVAPHKSMLTLFRPSSYLGTTKKHKTPYSSLASMCSSSLPKMQGMFLLFDESLRVFNVHFLIVILQIFRFNLRGLETNIIDWKTIKKHIHCMRPSNTTWAERKLRCLETDLLSLILAEYKFSNCSSKSLFTKENVSLFMSSPALCCALFTDFLLDNANLNDGVFIN